MTEPKSGAYLSRRRRFEADLIVNRVPESLLAPKVSLRRLDAYMTERELDLLKLPTGFVAQTSASAAQIVQRYFF